jgi:hypothetical protein
MRRLISIGIPAVFAAMLAGGLWTNGASAAAACRSDPVVTLSNGTQVTLYEDIYDSASDVSSISYELHVPGGVTVQSVVYSGSVATNLQTINVIADEKAGSYDTYTVVRTNTPYAVITAYMSVNNSKSSQTSGLSGQLLHTHLHVN